MSDLINRLLSRAEFEDNGGCCDRQMEDVGALLQEAANEICSLKSRIEIRGASVKRVQAEALDEAVESIANAITEEYGGGYAKAESIVLAALASLPEAPVVPVVTVSDKTVRLATKEYLSHKGETPERVLKGGRELWEDHAPAIRAALSVVLRVSAPTAPTATAITEFAAAILHGDDEHRGWLMEAAEAFNAGQPMPAPRGKGTSPAPTAAADGGVLPVGWAYQDARWIDEGRWHLCMSEPRAIENRKIQRVFLEEDLSKAISPGTAQGVVVTDAMVLRAREELYKCSNPSQYDDAVRSALKAAFSLRALSPGTADIPEGVKTLLREAREQINHYADTAREHDLIARIDEALASPSPNDREAKP